MIRDHKKKKIKYDLHIPFKLSLMSFFSSTVHKDFCDFFRLSKGMSTANSIRCAGLNHSTMHQNK